MNDQQREKLATRYWNAEDKIRAIHAGNRIHGDPAPTEGQLLTEQSEIEFLLGTNYFERTKSKY